MAVIAMIGVNPKMGTTADAVTGTMQNHAITYVQYDHRIEPT
jgi:hypothetical protein